MSNKKKTKANRRTEETPAPTSPGAAAATADQNPTATVSATATKWRWPVLFAALVGLCLLITFLSWVKLFDQVGVDYRLRDLLISNARTTTANVFHRRVWTILVDNKKQNPNSEAPAGSANPSHRKAHAQLVRLLTKARAKVIVFDVEFESRSAEFDPDFAAAIQEANQAGTKVVVAGFLEGEASQLQVSDLLRPAIRNNVGIVDGGILKRPSDARFIPLVGEKYNPETGPEERPMIPSIALLAVSLSDYPNEEVSTWYHPFTNEVRLRNRNGELLEAIPVDDEKSILVELVERHEMPHRTYEQVLDDFSTHASRFENAIVVVGYQEGDVLGLKGLDGSPRYGVEMHANAISALLGRTYIRPLPFLIHFATIVALIALGACLQIRCGSWMSHKLTLPIPITLPAPFDKIQIPTAIVVIFFIYGLTAILLFKWGHIILNMSYHLAALILTYILFVLFRSKLTVQ